MRVCFIPCDLDGSGSYRCLFPGREMEKLGHETFTPPGEKVHREGKYIIDYKFRSIPDADVYVLQRRLEPEWAELTRQLREVGKTVVAETDDWFLGIPGYNGAGRGTQTYKKSYAVEHDYRGQPHIVAVRRERKYGNRENLHAGFAAATLMTVTTEFLAEQYARFNPNIHILPNFLDWEMWENVQPQYEVERERIRIGYMGGSEWHSGDVAILRGLIGPFMRRHPECEFVVCGNDNENLHDLLEIPVDQRVTYGRAAFVDLPQITAVMDIGLVPLEANNFNEAKSCLKGMEYAACGVPCIASPTQSYRGWVDEGTNGFLASKPRKWISHLETLVSDDDLRRSMGRSAREKAQHHTVQTEAHRWESLYQAHLSPSGNAEHLFACL